MTPEQRESLSKSIGAIIKANRIACNLSRRQLESIVGVSDTVLARIESGRIMPKLDHVIALADYFGFSLDDICLERGL